MNRCKQLKGSVPRPTVARCIILVPYSRINYPPSYLHWLLKVLTSSVLWLWEKSLHCWCADISRSNSRFHLGGINSNIADKFPRRQHHQLCLGPVRLQRQAITFHVFCPFSNCSSVAKYKQIWVAFMRVGHDGVFRSTCHPLSNPWVIDVTKCSIFS